MSDAIPMVLHCPECKARHIDEGEFAIKPHHTHSCQECGLTWRPAVVATVGVEFLPGFKNEGGAEDAAAAYVFDRAHQYEQSSGCFEALTKVASALAQREHLKAFRHGELRSALTWVANRRKPVRIVDAAKKGG